METNFIEQITARVAVLPLEKQREALALIESLAKKERPSSSATPTIEGSYRRTIPPANS